jgi:hypothetical protein
MICRPFIFSFDSYSFLLEFDCFSLSPFIVLCVAAAHYTPFTALAFTTFVLLSPLLPSLDPRPCFATVDVLARFFVPSHHYNLIIRLRKPPIDLDVNSGSKQTPSGVLRYAVGSQSPLHYRGAPTRIQYNTTLHISPLPSPFSTWAAVAVVAEWVAAVLPLPLPMPQRPSPR